MPNISDLLDSDMEESHFLDENSIISSVSDTADVDAQTDTAAKRSRKRHRVTMPKPKARPAKSSPVAINKKMVQKPGNNKRKLLENARSTGDIRDTQTNHLSEAEEGMEVEPQPKKERKSGRKKTVGKGVIATEQGPEHVMEVEQTPVVARSNFAQGAATKAAPKVTKASKAKPSKMALEIAVASLQVDPNNSLDQAEEIDEIAAQQPPTKRARTESRSLQDQAYRRRAGSASDTERGDPNLRRKLGDITRKFENIDTKYKNLKDVAIGEANANVEKLRKQCEATTEASNNLIASLKKELTQQALLLQDARKLKKEIQARDDEIAILRSSQAELDTSRAELTASLGTAQNEIKALQAKLAAARTVQANVELPPVRVPGSAMKLSKTTGAVNGDASQAAQIAQMKLDLYGDLTGLIVRSVKRSAEGDTYECIQTGRNGTLHFKLFIDQEDAKTATFEETEFLYTPLLNEDRDRDMIELMPPYLTEAITFARQNAAKFYQRVVDTLTRRAQEE